MSRDQSLDEKMDKIAHVFADCLLNNQPVDKESNDAWKVLTQYWTAATKLDKVSETENGANSGGFGGIKARIAAAGKTDGTSKPSEGNQD